MERFAHDGVVNEVTLNALRRLRAADIRLLLVTGRELPSLSIAFPYLKLFDRIVAENGALLYDLGQATTQCRRRAAARASRGTR